MASEHGAAKYPVKKNDMVMVITGRERGKTGKVLKVIPASGRVIIERLNIVKRHSKPRGAAVHPVDARRTAGRTTRRAFAGKCCC